MSSFSFEQFESAKRRKGFDDVLERVWKPGATTGTHAHPFAVEALVVDGELWLSCKGQTRHLQPGDTFALDRDVPHAERYGEHGAVFWAARRNS